jgi:hypothetical protein
MVSLVNRWLPLYIPGVKISLFSMGFEILFGNQSGSGLFSSFLLSFAWRGEVDGRG